MYSGIPLQKVRCSYPLPSISNQRNGFLQFDCEDPLNVDFRKNSSSLDWKAFFTDTKRASID